MDIDSSNQKDLEKLLQEDALDRNKNINTLIRFINAIDGNYVLNLDGGWGTGKTIFLKEIECLNSVEHNKIQNLNNIEENIVLDFQKQYDVFYFNSWENDLYNSPLESLIYELLFYYRGKNEGGLSKEISQLIEEKLGVLFKVGIKILTGGTIELADLKTAEDSQTHLISSINAKKDAVKDIVETLTEMTGKKLLIIVDELDRCKPTYAVEYLEVVKHFFTQDNVIFLFGTNKSELVNTVKQSYGPNFDGYKYLNRFFDFEFNLPSVNIDKYIYSSLKDQDSKFNDFKVYYSKAMRDVCLTFSFSLRDINRYYTLCNALKSYWLKRSAFELESTFMNFIMVPYAIGLKIHSDELYRNLLSGEESGLMSFCYKNDFVREIFFKHIQNQEVFDFENEINKIMSILKNDEHIKREFYQESYQVEEMVSLLSMLSDITIN